MRKTVTCRYGIQYEAEFNGTEGECNRGFKLLEKCCCWLCRNYDCKDPKDEILEDCHNACEIYVQEHYCDKPEETKPEEV